MSGDARVGTSGWTYRPWRGGPFYPAGLPQRRELAYLASRLSSVEVNGSFYALQRPASFVTWRDATPAGFLFAVKGGRFITHMKRLRDVDVPLANFFASGVLALRDKLGPILWQLPPTLPPDVDLLADFVGRLPRTTKAAAELARGHDERVAGRAYLDVDEDRPVRHALEVRHPGFADHERLTPVRRLLAEHGVALVTADSPGRWPLITEPTTDFAYVRLHGDVELYASGYTAEALDRWAERIRGWTGEGRDVVAYFDNDAKVHAPHDAIELAARLGDAPR